MSGQETVRKLTPLPCPVILMASDGSVALAVKAMKAGAADFIEKPRGRSAAARNRWRLGRRPQSPPMTRRKFQAEARLANLSPRGRDVLRGLLAGKLNNLIARDLGISPRKVEVHKAGS
ncbi:hypothetical protein AS156_06610 [Bradyrhizobium macuxiense]|uniref:Response regulatory domain-containing protein n=2 Tax=Bradyrhizobium macuxiense TaxID=1755647 RepID=A0A109JT30_9BRAD|nr:hypothetical protein AS156_06610 [Bradyrhizobium macuxiense]